MELLTVGARVRGTRESRGVSQATLARKVGVAAPTMWRYESGRIKPSIDVLSRIAEALGVSMEWLTTGRGDPPVAPAALPEAS